MDQTLKAAQVDGIAAEQGLVRVEVLALEDLAGVVQGLDNGGLAAELGPKSRVIGLSSTRTGSRMPLKFSMVMAVIDILAALKG